MDTIGVTLAGLKSDTATAILDFASATGGAPTATLIGTDRRTDVATAAFVNGTVGHALDYDDVSWSMIGHPSVAVLPAVLAVAEKYNLSGQDVVTSYAVGFEVAAKLGAVLNPRHYLRGWHATGTLGTMGAAAAVANALGFSTEATARTLGIAASLASGLRQNFGTDTKPLHAGNAARNGVVAAELAKRGFTADGQILETQWGFARVLADPDIHLDSTDLEILGNPWEIVDPGLLLKMYPSCVSTHTALDAVLSLRERHGLTGGQVKDVKVGVVDLTTKILIHNRPWHGLQGKFSMPYCMARALLDGELRLNHFSDAAIRDPAAQTLLRKVAMTVDPSVSDVWKTGKPRGAIVTVTAANGATYRERVDVPSGMGEKLSIAAVKSKFADCARYSQSGADMEQATSALLGLENADDVAGVLNVVALEHGNNGRPSREIAL